MASNDPAARELEQSDRSTEKSGEKHSSIASPLPQTELMTIEDTQQHSIIRFPADMSSPSHRRLAEIPDCVVDGDPRHQSMTRFTNEDGRLQAGTWLSTPGKWRVFKDKDEFCTLLEGRAVLESLSGECEEFVAGDSFLIPNGFDGYWDVKETARKHFVILNYDAS